MPLFRVFIEMYRSAAISPLLYPAAIRAMTVCWRGQLDVGTQHPGEVGLIAAHLLGIGGQHVTRGRVDQRRDLVGIHADGDRRDRAVGERASGQPRLQEPGQGEHPAGVAGDEVRQLGRTPLVAGGETEHVVDDDVGVCRVRHRRVPPVDGRELVQEGADPGRHDRLVGHHAHPHDTALGRHGHIMECRPGADKSAGCARARDRQPEPTPVVRAVVMS